MIEGANGKGAEGGNGGKLELQPSWPDQRKPLPRAGCCTPPHNHPTSALADTAQPRRYGYNTHILGQCKKKKTFLNRRPTQFTASRTNPHTHIFIQTHRNKDMQTQAYTVTDACTHVCRHAQRNMKEPNVTVEDRLPRARHCAGYHMHVTSLDPPNIYL